MSEIEHAHHEHCWHSAEMMLTSPPPKHPEVCCHCGKTRTRPERRPDPKGHGPHRPIGT